MENASKALLIAGGILLTMLMIALVIFAWQQISQFYASQDELYLIEDTAKFNEQFTGYERDKISGYELVSLANKIADYNFRYSNATDAKNDKKYIPIEMEINFNGKQSDLAYGNDNKLFLTNTIKTNATQENYNMSKNTIGYVLNTVAGIEQLYGSSDSAAKVAKSISTIVREEAAQNYYYKEWKQLNSNERKALEELCVNNFNKIMGTNFGEYGALNTYLGTNGTKIFQYYEYYQFKKGIFKCVSVKYDGDDSTDTAKTGRVKYMKFEFTGKIE